jgi:hypothetical protein
MSQQMKQQEYEGRERTGLGSNWWDVLRGLETPSVDCPPTPVMPVAPVLRPQPMPDEAFLVDDGFMLE